MTDWIEVKTGEMVAEDGEIIVEFSPTPKPGFVAVSTADGWKAYRIAEGDEMIEIKPLPDGKVP